ncbi:bifunctional 2-C-methyl-D-erythritol 4-phosphate cytidylyltransferase/2-C-methyl-D-erythritol 2,4-cyclodiphosphate synthase [Aureimonas leprariae]|uniref:Bifunctional enzyme IspD/IspF n=1 Tax=Plantimonas leprariae TaxID=2615207 RepID=A0A7V7TY96_9HYPH|nr:bifunctional 2-C-methyl-D-erythritol 4-phosphate cytidylyltransferase/2-C-methyl-D-erythritol 2,4-cyclodiphosphate synthase [Aureimonas leprariae]KAB0682086.1 bifunctional 2-C-methyl-D-erythritol 4-phosphate cytidylyltransferase/2-C-methyl-D-erythritol 2,4-cyclodiphosphate synthase [Aureimonas leprariae]
MTVERSNILAKQAGRVGVVIVAAGQGSRAGGDAAVPKQFRSIGGRTVLERAIACFEVLEEVAAVVVVVGEADIPRAREMRMSSADLRFVAGGPTRQRSVRAGLEALGDDPPAIVLIHDAARPFADADMIRRVIAGVEPDVGALPAVAVSDTLKRVGADRLVEATVDRSRIHAAQTPQGFAYAAICAAHADAADAGLHDCTDDTAVLEWHGGRTKLVEGSTDNIKLTFPADFERAEAMLARGDRMIDVRTGNGYDVHRLVEGTHVTLCGVRIAHDQALSGHSDADVGLHALTDALLATCGEGDIGVHFPPSDERWRGAASHIFVRHAVDLVRRHGGTICNVDVTLIAEAPKILPHRDAMCAALSEMTGLDRRRVSVKATTNETIGFVGRREGIAAIATASVSYAEHPE